MSWRPRASQAAARKWWTTELAALAVTPEQVVGVHALVDARTVMEKMARARSSTGVLAGESSPTEVVSARVRELVGI